MRSLAGCTYYSEWLCTTHILGTLNGLRGLKQYYMSLKGVIIGGAVRCRVRGRVYGGVPQNTLHICTIISKNKCVRGHY